MKWFIYLLFHRLRKLGFCFSVWLWTWEWSFSGFFGLRCLFWHSTICWPNIETLQTIRGRIIELQVFFPTFGIGLRNGSRCGSLRTTRWSPLALNFCRMLTHFIFCFRANYVLRFKIVKRCLLGYFSWNRFWKVICFHEIHSSDKVSHSCANLPIFLVVRFKKCFSVRLNLALKSVEIIPQ